MAPLPTIDRTDQPLLKAPKHFRRSVKCARSFHSRPKRADRDEARGLTCLRGLIVLPVFFASLFLLCAATVPYTASASVNVAHSNATALSSGLVGYWSFDGGTLNWNTGTCKMSRATATMLRFS